MTAAAEWVPVDFGDDISVHRILEEACQASGASSLISSVLRLNPFSNTRTSNAQELRACIQAKVAIDVIVAQRNLGTRNMLQEAISLDEWLHYGYGLHELSRLGWLGDLTQQHHDERIDTTAMLQSLTQHWRLDKNLIKKYSHDQLSIKALLAFFPDLLYAQHLKPILGMHIFELGPHGCLPCQPRDIARLGVRFETIMQEYPRQHSDWIKTLGHLRLPFEFCTSSEFGLTRQNIQDMRMTQNHAIEFGWKPESFAAYTRPAHGPRMIRI